MRGPLFALLIAVPGAAGACDAFGTSSGGDVDNGPPSTTASAPSSSSSTVDADPPAAGDAAGAQGDGAVNTPLVFPCFYDVDAGAMLTTDPTVLQAGVAFTVHVTKRGGVAHVGLKACTPDGRTFALLDPNTHATVGDAGKDILWSIPNVVLDGGPWRLAFVGDPTAQTPYGTLDVVVAP